MNRNLTKYFDATTIKIVAVVLMFIDHIHEMFVPMGLVPGWLDGFGRPVFPLFLFLAADSFHYTRSRAAYVRRLFIASCCMVILTSVTQRIVPNSYGLALMNNAFGTFLVAALYMWSWDFLKKGVQEKCAKDIAKGVGLALLPVLTMLPMLGLSYLLLSGQTISTAMIQAVSYLVLLFPGILTVEGGAPYVVLGLLFYIFRGKKPVQVAIVLLYAVVYQYLGGGIQWCIALAVPLMLLYNGKKGRGMKNFFYIFYPAHIIVLYLLACLVANSMG